MKSIASSRAVSRRVSIRQKRRMSISKRLEALNQRGIHTHRRTFIFHGSKNKTPGSFITDEIPSLGASLKTEKYSPLSRVSGLDSFIRKSASLKKTKIDEEAERKNQAVRQTSADIIGFTPQSNVADKGDTPKDIDLRHHTSIDFAKTQKIIKNRLQDIALCCNIAVANNSFSQSTSAEADSSSPTKKENQNEEITQPQLQPESQLEHPCTSKIFEAIKSINPNKENIMTKQSCQITVSGTVNASPQKNFAANKSRNEKIEKLVTSNALNSISVKKSDEPLKHRSARFIKKKSTNPAQRKQDPKPEPKLEAKPEPEPEQSAQSPEIRYRKLFYNEAENKWIEHIIVQEEHDPAQIRCPKIQRDSGFDDMQPRRLKGRQKNTLKEVLPTAFVVADKQRKCPYDKILVNDTLRVELHKRNMPIVPPFFQEYIFKYGKLPFRGNPRPY